MSDDTMRGALWRVKGIVWGSALLLAGIRALISRNGEPWPDLTTWILFAPLLFTGVALLFSHLVQRVTRTSWENSVQLGIEHTFAVFACAIAVDTLNIHLSAHVVALRSIRETITALFTLDLYPSNSFTLGTSIGLLVSSAWLWTRLRFHASSRAMIQPFIQHYLLWMGVVSIPSFLAWTQLPAIAWSGSTTMIARAFTLIHQDGYWWRHTSPRFLGMNDGELITSEKLFLTTLVWLSCIIIFCIPWRTLWHARVSSFTILREHSTELLFVAYGGILAIIMRGVELTFPTSMVAFAVLVFVLGTLLSTHLFHDQLLRYAIILSGAWLLGWPVFALFITLLFLERTITELPPNSSARVLAWLGGIPLVAYTLIGYAWVNLSTQPGGLPWSIIISVVVITALPEIERLAHVHITQLGVLRYIFSPLIYVGLGGLGSGLPGALLGLGCGALSLLFYAEGAQNTWKIRLIQWVFLVVGALMTISHPISP